MKLGDNVKKETRLTEKQKKISGKRYRQLCGITLSEDIVDDYCQECLSKKPFLNSQEMCEGFDMIFGDCD